MYLQNLYILYMIGLTYEHYSGRSVQAHRNQTQHGGRRFKKSSEDINVDNKESSLPERYRFYTLVAHLHSSIFVVPIVYEYDNIPIKIQC
jgi:hypothetical protein